MSDEDRDVDIESEDDDLDGDEKGAGGQYQTQVSRRKVTCYRNPIVRSDPNKSRPPGRRLSDHTLLHNPPNRAEKRAHHNALERKRRDHIKDSFSGLRDSIPALHGEKVASRAQILKKAADYIQSMRKKNTIHQQDIDDLKRQNHMLELQIRSLEKSRTTGGSFPGFDGGSGTETSDSESASHQQRRKKMKVVSSAAVNSSSDT